MNTNIKGKYCIILACVLSAAGAVPVIFDGAYFSNHCRVFSTSGQSFLTKGSQSLVNLWVRQSPEIFGVSRFKSGWVNILAVLTCWLGCTTQYHFCSSIYNCWCKALILYYDTSKEYQESIGVRVNLRELESQEKAQIN